MGGLPLPVLLSDLTSTGFDLTASKNMLSPCPLKDITLTAQYRSQRSAIPTTPPVGCLCWPCHQHCGNDHRRCTAGRLTGCIQLDFRAMADPSSAQRVPPSGKLASNWPKCSGGCRTACSCCRSRLDITPTTPMRSQAAQWAIENELMTLRNVSIGQIRPPCAGLHRKSHSRVGKAQQMKPSAKK